MARSNAVARRSRTTEDTEVGGQRSEVGVVELLGCWIVGK